MVKFLLAIVFFFGTSAVQSQTDSLLQTKIETTAVSPLRLAVVVTSSAGIVTVSHLQNYNSWWKGDLVPFHICHDEFASLHADKYGHFLFALAASDIMGRSFQWAGVEHQRAMLYGAGLSLAFQLYVEVEDGFHPELGFSVGDMIADISGAAFPLAQEHFKFLQPVSFKWSAIQSQRYQRGAYRTLIDDYESQYHWLSVNIHDALGNSCPSFIPTFLNIALGYGVKNLDGKGNGTAELYLSLDIDFRKLPGKGDFLTAIKYLLNYIHCPAPTVRITPDITFYGIRF